MKSVLIVGMGRMGRHLAAKMQELGNEVMVMDKDRDVIEGLAENYANSAIGDCTNTNVVKTLGVSHFDICFVTIGDDFQASLVVTSLLKQFGAKLVVAKAKQDIQADLLKKIGADEVVRPEREAAEKLAIRYNAKNIFDFVQLNSEYAIYEIPVLPAWVGCTLGNLNLRKKYLINIIAVKKENELRPVPSADYCFTAQDHVIVIGRSSDVFRLVAKT